MHAMKDRVDTRGELRQFISFSVGNEEYGLEALRVKEVIRIREIDLASQGSQLRQRDHQPARRCHPHHRLAGQVRP